MTSLTLSSPLAETTSWPWLLVHPSGPAVLGGILADCEPALQDSTHTHIRRSEMGPSSRIDTMVQRECSKAARSNDSDHPALSLPQTSDMLSRPTHTCECAHKHDAARDFCGNAAISREDPGSSPYDCRVRIWLAQRRHINTPRPSHHAGERVPSRR